MPRSGHSSCLSQNWNGSQQESHIRASLDADAYAAAPSAPAQKGNRGPPSSSYRRSALMICVTSSRAITPPTSTRTCSAIRRCGISGCRTTAPRSSIISIGYRSSGSGGSGRASECRGGSSSALAAAAPSVCSPDMAPTPARLAIGPFIRVSGRTAGAASAFELASFAFSSVAGPILMRRSRLRPSGATAGNIRGFETKFERWRRRSGAGPPGFSLTSCRSLLAG